jgi:hypothetical protein
LIGIEPRAEAIIEKRPVVGVYHLDGYAKNNPRPWRCRMRRMIVLAAVVSMLVTTLAFGLGGDYSPKDPVGKNTKWPAGLHALITSRPFVHGYFIFADDYFFYQGDETALNVFLAQCGQIQGAPLKLVLDPGKGEAKSPWDKKPGKACDWELGTVNLAWRRAVAKKPPTGPDYGVEIIVYTATIDVTKLKIPLSMNVEVGGAIGRVIEQHRAAQEKAKAAAERAAQAEEDQQGDAGEGEPDDSAPDESTDESTP